MINPVERPNLYERLTPEALERLNAIKSETTKLYIINMLKKHEFFTMMTVGDMHSLLFFLEVDLSYRGYLDLFK